MEIKTSIKRAAAGAVTLIGAAAIAAHFIAPLEGEKYYAYPDGGGVWTICRGHTDGVKPGDIATQNQCDLWYAKDIGDAEAIYDKYVYTILPDNTKAAAISFIFNTGRVAFKTSTLLKKINQHDRAGACAQFVRWKLQDAPKGSGYDMADGVKDGKANCFLDANKKFCGGLKTRRLAETKLCLDNTVYSSFTWTPSNAFAGVKK